MLNLSILLEDSARKYPDRDALVLGPTRMTYAEVDRAANQGEEVKAFVILKTRATATTAEIVAWGKEQMASYKYPRIVEIVDSLPMTATGKILKRELT